MTHSHRRLLACALLVALPLSLQTASSDAAPKAKRYSSCAKLQKVYPHGVGKAGARDRTSGTPVTTFKKSTKIYNLNNGPRNKKTGEYDLDRDNDGVACEKR